MVYKNTVRRILGAIKVNKDYKMQLKNCPTLTLHLHVHHEKTSCDKLFLIENAEKKFYSNILN